MAQLNDLIVTGNSRFINKTYTSTADVECVTASSAAGATEHSAGTIGQALVSDGDSVYWGDPQHADTTDEAQHATSAATLDDTEFIEDNEPYLFREAPSEVGNRVYEDAIVGGSVAWNQLVQIPSSSISNTKNGCTVTDNRDGSYTVSGTPSEISIWKIKESFPISQHKYCVLGMAKVVGLIIADSWGNRLASNSNTIFSVDSVGRFDLSIVVQTSFDGTSTTIKPQIFDLTQMFGSAIANYAYSLETSEAGSGIAWLKSQGFFTKDYYAYNAGGIASVETSAKKVTEFNQWDEQWEVGNIDDTTGIPISDSGKIRSKNFCNILPSTIYYAKSPQSIRVLFYDTGYNFIGETVNIKNETFTSLAGSAYFKVRGTNAYGSTYNHDICINLRWDGERDGEYEAYEEHTYPLDSDLELRGIPKLDSANKLYYDGDTYESDGTVTRKYGIVDLGSLTWVASRSTQGGFYATIPTYKNSANTNMICGRYLCDGYGSTARGYYINNKTFRYYYTSAGSPSYEIYVYDTAYSDATSFKTAMNGVYLVYELATPTTESADPYTNPQWVSNWGTEEFVDEREVAIPVGHNSRYPKTDNYKLANIPAPPGGAGNYIVHTDEYGESVYQQASDIKVNYAGTADLGMRRVFIQGTQTTATTTGLWTGDASPYFNSAADLVDGQEITYWLPLPTTGNATLNLKFGDGTSSGALNCYYGNTSRLTTHYGQGNAIHLTYRKNVKIPSTGSTTYTGWWADANYDSNSNNIDILQGTYTIPVAGATAGLKQYSLFAEDANGKYSSFTTQNGTAVTKTVNRTDYFDISKIYYCSTGGNYATNANIGTSIVRWAQPLVDLRYTLNISTSALTARKPLYLVFDKTATTSNAISDTLYKLAGTGTTDWWTQTLPTSADGKIYAEISKALYDGYRGDLSVAHKYYEYTDKLHDYDSISALKNADTITATFEISSGSLVCDIPYELLVTYKPEQIKGRFHLLDTSTSTETVEYTITDSVAFIENENYNYFIFYFENATIGYSSISAEFINTGSYNTAFAHIEGYYTTASGYASHAEGYYTRATSTASHAEGRGTYATSDSSHAEGNGTTASNSGAHAEGVDTKATGVYSHAEGGYTAATESQSHAEGLYTTASATGAHSEGYYSVAKYSFAHAEGYQTTANQTGAHSEGYQTRSEGAYAHAEGNLSTASGYVSHAEGNKTSASTSYAHAEGDTTRAISQSSHAEGQNTTASSLCAHAEGNATSASGQYSHAEGNSTKASSTASHSSGSYTTASGPFSHTEGVYTLAQSSASHAEGTYTVASADSSHAEGYNTTASAPYSHTEGYGTRATYSYAHAEGYATSAIAPYTHAEGNCTNANAQYAHVGGSYTIANKDFQTVIGKYNSTVNDALFIIGKGTATNARSNAMYVTTAGELYTSWLNGTVRSTPLSNGKFNRLVMPPYVDGGQLYPLQVEYGRTLSDSGIGTFGVLTNYNTYTVDLNIALTQQSNPYVFTATISYPTTMYSAPSFIFLVPRDKSTGVNSRVCYNNGYGIDRQPTNFPASAWADGKTSGVHQLQVSSGSAGTAYVTAIMGWR